MPPTEGLAKVPAAKTNRDYLARIGKNRVALYDTTFTDSGNVVTGLEISFEKVGKYDPTIQGRKSEYVQVRFNFEEVVELAKVLLFDPKLNAKVNVQAALTAALASANAI